MKKLVPTVNIKNSLFIPPLKFKGLFKYYKIFKIKLVNFRAKVSFLEAKMYFSPNIYHSYHLIKNAQIFFCPYR
ncbi:MAG: hypothetical protein PWQ34_1676 [Caldanaerobacter sp.]|nr:hypothetical protein [Caldanaerobacter sp.]